jgi:preprotein translocase subunit SecE
MSPEKLFQKKTQEGGEQYENTEKPKAPKRGAPGPPKPKKPEGAKKVQKKPDEPPKATVWWNQFRQYLREVSYELRKVIWPSRKETIGSTAVVLIIVILASIFLGIVDAILSRLVRLLVG